MHGLNETHEHIRVFWLLQGQQSGKHLLSGSIPLRAQGGEKLPLKVGDKFLLQDASEQKKFV